LPAFTLIAATTRVGLLSSPLRSRFGATFRVDFYSEEDIKKILRRSAAILNVSAAEDGLLAIAKASRATPRVANRLLKRVRDFSEVNNSGVITRKTALAALNMLEVDELGLEPTDRRLLGTLIHKFNGGPAGIQTLAAAASEEEDTIEEIYEPYLMQLGFLAKTPRGRVATPPAYKHLGLEPPEQNALF
jgi:Holliday junction DNA helicase RuvB